MDGIVCKREFLHEIAATPLGSRNDRVGRFVHGWRFLHRRGDVCERRLRREKRAKRSGRIKAIGKRALPAQTEPLIQQNMSPPYIGIPAERSDAFRYSLFAIYQSLCLHAGG